MKKETVAVMLSLPKSMSDALETAALPRGVTKQTIIRELISAGLKLNPPLLTTPISASSRFTRRYPPRLWTKQTIQFPVSTFCLAELKKRRLRVDKAQYLKTLLKRGAFDIHQSRRSEDQLQISAMLTRTRVGVTLDGDTLTKLDKVAYRYGMAVHSFVAVCVFFGEQALIDANLNPTFKPTDRWTTPLT